MSDIVSLVVLLVLLLIVAVIAAAGYAGYAYYKQAGSPQPNPDGSGLQSPLPKVTYDPKGGWRSFVQGLNYFLGTNIGGYGLPPGIGSNVVPSQGSSSSATVPARPDAPFPPGLESLGLDIFGFKPFASGGTVGDYIGNTGQNRLSWEDYLAKARAIFIGKSDKEIRELYDKSGGVL